MKSIFLFVLLALSTFLLAQNPSAVDCEKKPSRTGSNSFLYTYDFTNLQPELDCFLKPRHKKDRIFVRINNINRLAYDVQATGESTSIPLPKINIFDSLAGTLNTAALDQTTKEIDGVPESTRSVLNPNRAQKGAGKYILVPNNDPYLAQKQKIAALQTEINSDYQQLVTDIKQLEYFLNFGKNLPLLVASECCSQSALQSRILLDPNLSFFYEGIGDFNELRSVVNNTPLAIIKDLKEKEQNIKKKKEEADKLLTEIRKNCKINKTQDQDICDVDELENNYPEDLQLALQNAGKLNTKDIAEGVNKLNELLAKVDNAQNFRFASKQFMVEGDQLQLKTIFRPRGGGEILNADSVVVTLPVKGRFEWAIGPALNFQVSKASFNYSYRVDSSFTPAGVVKSDTFSIKRNAVRNQLIPSIGVMANFYWQNHAAITPGITLGLSTSPTNLSDLKAYLGISALVGSLTDKVIFSAGVVGGSVDRLKPNLVEGENRKGEVPFSGDKIAAPSEFIQKVFKLGFYFGFTYKLNN